MSERYNRELKVMKEAAALAGASLARYFTKRLTVRIKQTNADFLTRADLSANKIITNTVNKKLPHVTVYSEEKKVNTAASEYVLVVDPLDGTNNLVLGIPTFSSALTLLYQGKPVAAVINLPLTKQLYWTNGQRSFLNKQAICTSKLNDIHHSVVAYQQDYLSAITYKTSFEKNMKHAGVTRVLNNWSPQFEYGLLASGRIHAVYARNMVCYDYAGGVLLALAAGAKIYYLKQPRDVIKDQASLLIAANQPMLNKMKLILHL